MSRVINQDPDLNIRPETRDRVHKAIARLGYRPNAAARSLRTSRSDVFGLLIPDFHNPVYAGIITGAEAAAKDHGSLLLTGTAPDGQLDSFLRLLGHGRIDGLLIGGIVEEQQKPRSPFSIPMLHLNRRHPSTPRYVVLDDDLAAAIAVRHLGALGHKLIGHLAGPPSADTAVRRKRGYRTAMKDLGLTVKNSLVVQSDYTSEGGRDSMRRLLAGPLRPTAVFAANVASAIGALRGAIDLGLRVPDDVSVVAVHDHPLASYLSPPLTTVRMPLEDLGRRGIELLSSLDAGAEIREVLAGPLELVERESTAPPGPGTG